MKLNANLKIVIVITSLLLVLSISISLINFFVSLSAKQTELETRSLPLSVQNIYSEIQSNIIEPNLISSMMAHDTFVNDWLVHEEESHKKIEEYLAAIQKKYGMFLTFLASEKTLNYYSQKGFIEKLNPKNQDNQWYFRFKNSNKSHEINLDYNDQFSNTMIMFINHKIVDKNNKLLGSTGIGMKMSYIDGILKEFRETYQFTVFFINKDGKVVLSERKENPLTDISQIPNLSALRNEIFSNQKKVLEYTSNGNRYLLNSQYIPELESYLLVQAKLADFTKQVRQTFYINLAFSMLITVIVIFVTLITVHRFNRKLEVLAQNDSLTHLKNRRAFNDAFTQYWTLAKRNNTEMSLIFFDVDNFKDINDNHGHQIGDKVLIRIAEILNTCLREADISARWGGEEFIIGLMNTSLNDAKTLSEKLRLEIAQDSILINLTQQPTTVSLGVTECLKEDSEDSIFHRLDSAMYEAKRTGKNKTVGSDSL
ncbi:sensor domain-containing diguanylate cyclase [Thiomicrorhabdus hydrogeniphila]